MFKDNLVSLRKMHGFSSTAFDQIPETLDNHAATQHIA